MHSWVVLRVSDSWNARLQAASPSNESITVMPLVLHELNMIHAVVIDQEEVSLSTIDMFMRAPKQYTAFRASSRRNLQRRSSVCRTHQ